MMQFDLVYFNHLSSNAKGRMAGIRSLSYSYSVKFLSFTALRHREVSRVAVVFTFYQGVIMNVFHSSQIGFGFNYHPIVSPGLLAKISFYFFALP